VVVNAAKACVERDRAMVNRTIGNIAGAAAVMFGRHERIGGILR
jgi:hypothetical protein